MESYATYFKNNFLLEISSSGNLIWQIFTIPNIGLSLASAKPAF